MIEHQLAEVEGNQRGGHGGRIQALDDGIVPIGLRSGTNHCCWFFGSCIAFGGRSKFWRGKAKLGAMPPVVARHQSVAVGHQIAQAHARMPAKAAGIGHRSAQRDRLAIVRSDGVDAHNVAVGQRRGQASRIGRQLECACARMVLDALDGDARAIGNGGSAAGGVEQIFDRSPRRAARRCLPGARCPAAPPAAPPRECRARLPVCSCTSPVLSPLTSSA